jgi:hypothetical protein
MYPKVFESALKWLYEESTVLDSSLKSGHDIRPAAWIQFLGVPLFFLVEYFFSVYSVPFFFYFTE